MQAESVSVLLRANSNCVGPDAWKEIIPRENTPSSAILPEMVDWKWKQDLALSNRLNPGEMAVLWV